MRFTGINVPSGSPLEAGLAAMFPAVADGSSIWGKTPSAQPADAGVARSKPEAAPA